MVGGENKLVKNYLAPGEDVGYNRHHEVNFGDEEYFSEDDLGHKKADDLLKSKNYDPVPIENRRSVDFKQEIKQAEIGSLEDMIGYIRKFTDEFGEAIVGLDYNKAPDRGLDYHVDAKYQFLDVEYVDGMRLNKKELNEGEPYHTMRENLGTLIGQNNYNVEFNGSKNEAYITPKSDD